MDRNCHLGNLWIEAVERGFAAATLSAYGDHLDDYLRFLRGRRLPVERVDAAVIAGYLEHLKQPASPIGQLKDGVRSSAVCTGS